MHLDLKIKNCIIVFPHLNVPQKKQIPSEPDKYGARFYLDKKNHVETINKINEFIDSCRDKTVKNPSSIKSSFKDGDENPNPYTAGKYFFDARNNSIIPLFNIFGKEIHDYKVVKQNGIVNIAVRVAYVEHFKIICFYLNGVQYIKDGVNNSVVANIFEDESEHETANVFSDEELNSHIMQ